jgi:hypothetical protein
MSGSEPTPERSRGEAEADENAGIFGNLPRSRPSVRSPRRADPEPDPVPSEAGADAGSEPAGPEAGGREAEVEAIARAGISLAGGAATLGLRVAGRAAAALRDAVERR